MAAFMKTFRCITRSQSVRLLTGLNRERMTSSAAGSGGGDPDQDVPCPADASARRSRPFGEPRDAAATGDPAIIALPQRAERVAGMSADLTRTAHAAGPVICPAFDFDEQVVAAIPAVRRFDSSVEVTTSRLRLS